MTLWNRIGSAQRRENARERALSISDKRICWFITQVLSWYEDFGRVFSWRRDCYPLYQVIVTELLLQRTRAETVDQFIGRFFRIYPDWGSLANSDPTDLQDELKPFGLWKRRATIIRRLAIEVQDHGDVLPEDLDSIKQLTGVGPYIANAVLMYRDGAAKPLLDASMARLLERFFGPRELVDIRDDPFLNVIAERVVKKSDCPKKSNWAMLDLAAKICVSGAPRCNSCPVSEHCPSSMLNGSSCSVVLSR